MRKLLALVKDMCEGYLAECSTYLDYQTREAYQNELNDLCNQRIDKINTQINKTLLP